MSKHTAGPWRVAVGFPAVESDTAPNLALCNDQSVSMTERMDNARLIAAAPELLEACRTLTGMLATEDWIVTLRLAVEQASAAIAKAGGNNE